MAETGGAQKVVLSLLEGTAAAGQQASLVCGPGGHLVQWVRNTLPGVEVHEIPAIRVRPSLLGDVTALLQLIGLFRRIRPLVVHVHSSKMALLGRLAAWFTRVPHIFYTVHGWAVREYHSPLAQVVYTWLERLGSRLSDRIICVAEFEREKALRLRLAPAAKLSVIYNGVTPAPLESGRLRSELGLAPSVPIVVGVGRLAEPKDPIGFIRMAAAVAARSQDTRFIWIGDGPLRDACEQEVSAKHLGDRVVFLGNREDARVLLNDADVVVLPSYGEALPLVILEAMRASRPVVATRVGGVPELVEEGGNGFLVEPGDHGGMAAVVSHLLERPELRKALGEAGYARAGAGFREEDMQRGYRALYGEQLGQLASCRVET